MGVHNRGGVEDKTDGMGSPLQKGGKRQLGDGESRRWGVRRVAAYLHACAARGEEEAQALVTMLMA